MALGIGLIGAGTFMSKEKWISYERYGRGTDKIIYTMPLPERPRTGYAAERPATKAEIAAEKHRREQRKQYAARQEAFVGREEYKDAQDIASRLELMDVNNNPLDRLTAQEWRELREKICR